ncbi:MAG: glutathione S-transferase [Sphingomonas sp.]|uniref:glutathione S-transferase n=1 Tax=Sphingomonas sp. TaxID=28214 RepID=UPI0017EFC49B|nr:glutathione S-transferase [Sphingomonas sp.]MBA3667644.1 glutathione S-transferase [Sphingomonas sp.]
MDALKLEDCVNRTCPWSGDPVSADSLTLYNGKVVGFCNTGCRDKFDRARTAFDAVIAGKD